MEEIKTAVDKEAGISVSIPKRTERARDRSISYDTTEKEPVYSGSYRCWKDDLDRISCSEGSW